jgi:hypothetical protein
VSGNFIPFKGKSHSLSSQAVRFLAASTECSAGSNDHFVVVVPSLVQFDGSIAQSRNLATLQRNNHATLHATEQSRNLATQQSRNLQRNNHATFQHNNNATL